MGNYRLTEKAEEDLRRIWLYGLETFGVTQADIYFEQFFTRFEQIAAKLMLAPPVDNIREGYRRAICGVDSIYYRINDDAVEIMRILGRQDISGEL
jgi:toxin ParE1/3/4